MEINVAWGIECMVLKLVFELRMINLVGQIIDNEILKMEEGGAKDPASDL